MQKVPPLFISASTRSLTRYDISTMTATGRKAKRPKSLAQGRPPTIRKDPASLSSKATRTLIRSHHRLHKRLAGAERVGDETAAQTIRDEIEAQGGLQSYQQASIQGQSRQRGGDTSQLLMQWLPKTAPSSPLRLLEVGALRIDNTCSRSPFFQVTRIDLNSQAPGIQQQDFMDRPLPSTDAGRFDIISLSLVLNYVPDARARGEMLRRTCQFLGTASRDWPDSCPCLFLVLPAPCVENSRYLDEALLTRMLASLGYAPLRRKVSSKLIYLLLRLDRGAARKVGTFRKQLLNDGPGRNNFCIILD